jgi:hypothetical protein
MNTLERVMVLQKQVNMLTDQQNSISVSLNRYGEVINNQAAMLKHHQNAIENMMEWLGDELGPDAVRRLQAYLGVEVEDKPAETGTQSVVCGNGSNP